MEEGDDRGDIAYLTLLFASQAATVAESLQGITVRLAAAAAVDTSDAMPQRRFPAGSCWGGARACTRAPAVASAGLAAHLLCMPPTTLLLQLPGDEDGYQLFIRPYKGEVELVQRTYPGAAAAATRELAMAAAEHAAAEAAAAAAAAAQARAKRKRKAAAAALERKQKKQRAQQAQQQLKWVTVRLPHVAAEGEPEEEVLVGCSLFCSGLPTPEPDALTDADGELRKLLR